jgi:hypothetical protein
MWGNALLVFGEYQVRFAAARLAPNVDMTVIHQAC